MSRAASGAVAGDWRATARNTFGVEITDFSPLSGGCVGEVYRLHLGDGRDVVAKVASRSDARLPLEAEMLVYLSTHTDLPVPSVFYSDASVLLMEYMAGESRFSAAAQESAAEQLARLHSMPAAAYGFHYDTLIGGLHQPNPWTESWIAFFASHRLRHMAAEGARAGRLPHALLHRVDAFAEHLDQWLEEPSQPSLIHGDVWTTNVLADHEHVTAFLDPAIYFAHPEIELAFITLFWTFGEPFFQRYAELRPIRPGFFEVRRDIYNLYPLLVHVRLFGGGYVTSVDRILKRLGY